MMTPYERGVTVSVSVVLPRPFCAVLGAPRSLVAADVWRGFAKHRQSRADVCHAAGGALLVIAPTALACLLAVPGCDHVL